MEQNEGLIESAVSPSAMALPRIYAGFWIRVVASLIDEFICLVPSTALSQCAIWILKSTSSGVGISESLSQGIMLSASLAIWFPYRIILHYFYGATLGKKLFGIRVIRAQDGQPITLGQSVGRTFASLISSLLFGLGYLMVIWDSRKQGLHDRLAGTVSVRLKTQELNG